MPDSGDALTRQWMLLQEIPRAPRSRSTAELHAAMRGHGFEVTPRTTQRDLERLSGIFPITCDEDGRSHRWYWLPDAAVTEFPGMSPEAAIAMLVAERYLAGLIPVNLLRCIRDYADRARRVLEAAGLHEWPSRIAVAQAGPPLVPPEAAPGVLEAVDDALARGRQLRVTYASRSRGEPWQGRVHPLGLVAKRGLLYLVCTINDHTDIRQLAIHRIHEIACLDQEAVRPDDFDLQDYVDKLQAFAYPRTGRPIRLVLAVGPEVAAHLEECPLSGRQAIAPVEGGRHRVQAEVNDSEELRWWLLGFGDQIEVLAPSELREELGHIARGMAERYSRNLPDET